MLTSLTASCITSSVLFIPPLYTMANHGPSYGLDAELEAKRNASYDQNLENDCRAFIESTTGESIGPDFYAGLKNGIILCQYALLPSCSSLSRLYLFLFLLLFSTLLYFTSPSLHLYLTSPHLTLPHLSSPLLSSPHLTSPLLSSPHLTCVDWPTS